MGKVEVSPRGYVSTHAARSVQPQFTREEPPPPVWDGAFPIVRMTVSVSPTGKIEIHDSSTSERYPYDMIRRSMYLK
jgi:hypothetical protein